MHTSPAERRAKTLKQKTKEKIANLEKQLFDIDIEISHYKTNEQNLTTELKLAKTTIETLNSAVETERKHSKMLEDENLALRLKNDELQDCINKYKQECNKTKNIADQDIDEKSSMNTIGQSEILDKFNYAIDNNITSKTLVLSIAKYLLRPENINRLHSNNFAVNEWSLPQNQAKKIYWLNRIKKHVVIGDYLGNYWNPKTWNGKFSDEDDPKQIILNAIDEKIHEISTICPEATKIFESIRKQQ